MKKYIFIFLFLFAISYSSKVFGIANTEVMIKQENALKISEFIENANKYSKDIFQDINLNDIYKDAISGKTSTNTNGLLKGIVKLAGKELNKTLKTIGYIFVIIILHSIIKSICEGFGNDEIGKITYYAQYILIVTLVMTNFSDNILMIKETINNLVGFLNSLLPILITLMITTGSIITASTVQPLLLIIITFIR